MWRVCVGADTDLKGCKEGGTDSGGAGVKRKLKLSVGDRSKATSGEKRKASDGGGRGSPAVGFGK